MSESSQSAEQIAMVSAKLAEIAARLSADGIKNLAALLFALAKKPKSQGATSVAKLFQDGSVPQVFQLKRADLDKFKAAAKEYGVLFSAIKHKDGEQDIDILVRMQDTPKINRILEKFGYGEPNWNMGKETTEKKSESHAQPENPLNMQENTSKETIPIMDDVPLPTDNDAPPLGEFEFIIPLEEDFDFDKFEFITPQLEDDLELPEQDNPFFTPEETAYYDRVESGGMAWQQEQDDLEWENQQDWDRSEPQPSATKPDKTKQQPQPKSSKDKAPTTKEKTPVRERVEDAKKVAGGVNKAVKTVGKELEKTATSATER